MKHRPNNTEIAKAVSPVEPRTRPARLPVPLLAPPTGKRYRQQLDQGDRRHNHNPVRQRKAAADTICDQLEGEDSEPDRKSGQAEYGAASPGMRKTGAGFPETAQRGARNHPRTPHRPRQAIEKTGSTNNPSRPDTEHRHNAAPLPRFWEDV